MAAARAMVAGRLGIAEDQVEGYFGQPFYVAEGNNPVRQEADGEFRRLDGARRGGRRLPRRSQRRPVQAAPRPRAGAALRGLCNGRPSGLALQPGAGSSRWQADRDPRRPIGAPSPLRQLRLHRVALDEALAEAGKLEPTDLQRAMWAAYEACGMWWPCAGRRLRRAPGCRRARRRSARACVGERLHRRWTAGRQAAEARPLPRLRARRAPAPPVSRMPSFRATIASAFPRCGPPPCHTSTAISQVSMSRCGRIWSRSANRSAPTARRRRARRRL